MDKLEGEAISVVFFSQKTRLEKWGSGKNVPLYIIVIL